MNQIKEYLKILRFVKPYWMQAILNVFFNLMYVVFSLMSLTMIVPYLRLLFDVQTGSASKVLLKHPPAFAFDTKIITDYFNYYMQNLLLHFTKTEALALICVVVIIMFLLKNLSRYMGIFFLAPIRNGVVKDIRNKIYRKILILPLSYFSEKRKGDIISRMTNDVLEIEWSILSSLENLFRDPLTILFYVIFLFILNVELTLFSMILLPVTGILISWIGKSLRRTSVKAQAKLGGILSVIEETLSGIRVIKAYRAIDITDDKFKHINNDYTRTAIRLYRKRDLASPLSEFLGICVVASLIWYGGRIVLSGSGLLNPELFIMYIVVFSQIIPPAKSVTTAFYNIQKGIASFERIDQVLQAEELILQKPDAKPVSDFKHYIEYRNVSFSYNEPRTTSNLQRNEVLRNINLKIEKGKTIALVGHSGSGKSTLVDLLPRFYDIVDGEIRIDDVPIKDFVIDDLRGLMGIVSQQTILFNDTLFNNIAFGLTGITEKQVKEAARIANADEFINQMPQNYYTNIGDSGNKLSGGQRQRISIARAVLRNPSILILDEATSSLDSKSERLVQQALENIMKNRTSIVIAHRLSTVIHADEIYVISEGEIVEHGNHNHLMSLNGHYKKLYDLQMFS
jgi:ATP-binding cassette, subfamily B, bacterial MsbA